MLDDTRYFIWRQIRAIKPSFISKNPHFNFISVHYFWIVGMSILGSVLIYATGGGNMPYVDALFFASGASTQAGLNPIDVNQLTTFQQVVIYLCAMACSPITIHTSVVFLRLYWFEKRFQNIVLDARHRRGTISKSKSKANADLSQAEMGVNGRNITVIRNPASQSRITNGGNPVDAAEMAGGQPGQEDYATDSTRHEENGEVTSRKDAPEKDEDRGRANQIAFASTVKRSDGLGNDFTKFSPLLSDDDHIGILRRERDAQDNEVLRIPGPRDAERGIGPKRLEGGEAPEAEDPEDDTLEAMNVGTPRTGGVGTNSSVRHRQPTIVIAEPERRRRDEMADEARVIGHTFAPLRFRKPRIFNEKNQKVHATEEHPKTMRDRTLDTLKNVWTREKATDMPYLSFTPTMGRNSQFAGLSLEQREELGGIEYRSLRTLALLLVMYFWGFGVFALACLLPFIKHNDHYGKIVEDVGMSRTWWGFFTANSAFMDLGFTLTPDSMNSFQTATWVLLSMSFLIIIGNTGFPVMLRIIIWISAHVVPKRTGIWEELRFLLDHPRRCFTLLFPAGATWWLFWILLILNGLDLIIFIVLDLNNAVVRALPVHVRVVNGLFQAAATRTAGFACINLALLHPAVQASYMIMMYISVFPIAISIRRTNVYEEKSLGVYQGGNDAEANENNAMSYVGTHLRRQLSFDLWYVFLGLFILAISEGSRIQKGDFDMFAVLFEIVSAYGTVGLSLGYPGVNMSLCSQFSTVGKLVLISMQIRGRHRGLPYGLDRAILLPSESRFEREAEEVQPGLQRSNTGMSTGTTSGMRRGRSRGRSRSMDRGNPNIITQLLHPGPIIPYDRGSGRSKSREGPRRVNSDPAVDTDDEPTEPGSQRRRAETVPDIHSVSPG